MSITVGGSIVGVSIGGRSNTNGWAEANVGGVPIKFEPGTNLATRQVQIGGGMTTTLMAGSSTSMSVNGVNVRSEGHDLWINGQKVDFSGGSAPTAAELEASKKSAKEKLEARFPGVQMSGHEYLQIEEGARIAAGAVLEGVPPGTVISGDSKIGPNARVSGGVIESSTVNGTVRGGNLRDSSVSEGGSVLGGNLRDTAVKSGGRVSGGNLRDTVVDQGGSVSGGNLRDMNVAGSVSGGNLRGFTVKAGESVSTGNHTNGIGQSNAGATGVVIRGGNFSGDVNMVLGNVSAGMTVVGANIVSTGDITIVNGKVIIG